MELTKCYTYDKNSKEFLYEAIAQVINKQICIPLNSTDKVPGFQHGADEVEVFDEEKQKWNIVKDYRGKTIYHNASKQPAKMKQPGEIPTGWTLTAPPSEYHKLNAENEWVPDTTKKQELITAIRANIDADTDAKILNDFKIEGVGFKLSLENQMNYKAEHELRDALTYPHKVKSIDGYHQFQDATEYHLFYLSAVAFIRTTIEAGWDAKDALEGLTTEELIDLL